MPFSVIHIGKVDEDFGNVSCRKVGLGVGGMENKRGEAGHYLF